MKGSGIMNRNFYTINEAFDYFFSNCTFSILSKNSTSGLILKLNLNENIESSFYYTTIGENFNKSVSSLIMKLILINNNKIEYEFGNIKKYTMNDQDFDKEVDVQIDVYNKSITDDEFLFEPICPAIVKTIKDVSPDIKKIIYKRFVDKEQTNKQLIRKFLSLSESINIIVMEAIEGFDTLFENCDVKYEKYALFDLIRLHKYGYVHGDYHTENILVNTNYKYYFGDTPELIGKTLILDFGRSKPIHYNKNLSLKMVLENEINSLPDKTYHSYVWLSYYLHNCFRKTNDYINYLYQNRVHMNQIVVTKKLDEYPKMTVEKIKIDLKIPQQRNGGKSRTKNKPRVRVTRRTR
jgi:serine/threonine protein kinase